MAIAPGTLLLLLLCGGVVCVVVAICQVSSSPHLRGHLCECVALWAVSPVAPIRFPVKLIANERQEWMAQKRSLRRGSCLRASGSDSIALGRAANRMCSAHCAFLCRYKGIPIEGVPFNDDWDIINNAEGQVYDLDGEPGEQHELLKGPPRGGGRGVALTHPKLCFDSRRLAVKGLYCAGWAKRGPSGIIGTNIPDAHETVAAVLRDFQVPLPLVRTDWSERHSVFLLV